MRIVPWGPHAITSLMWNLDRRRWEKGASASEMEAFIFLFCWSANVLKGNEKTWREKLIWKKRNHFIPDHTVKPISPFGLVQLPILGCCLLHSSVNIWKTDLKCPRASHFCPCSFFSKEISIYFGQSCTVAVFFLYRLWKTHMSDHGQGFPLLVSSSIVAMSVCQWRERLLKETIVRLHVVNGDGAIAGIRWTTGSFHQAPALSRSSPTGWTL